ncbi:MULTISPECIES: hypothetical protein [Sodalis]|uniref:Uncharacterized protein n=1 Tax=Sodalis ligni TaxID=2697027 RepID=A0A4R1NF92_9GAMM|nr:hypothetical protein [Sodalis ligni]TCL03336.1 hypothetical protein EZJ58_1398 [Sodalis ligni]
MKKVILCLAIMLATLPVATASFAQNIHNERVVVAHRHHHYVKKHVIRRHHPIHHRVAIREAGRNH